MGERDALITRVLPALEQRCAMRYVRLSLVDVRGNASVILVDEIERCQWMIVLRTEKRGRENEVGGCCTIAL